MEAIHSTKDGKLLYDIAKKFITGDFQKAKDLYDQFSEEWRNLVEWQYLRRRLDEAFPTQDANLSDLDLDGNPEILNAVFNRVYPVFTLKDFNTDNVYFSISTYLKAKVKKPFLFNGKTIVYEDNKLFLLDSGILCSEIKGVKESLSLKNASLEAIVEFVNKFIRG